MDLISAMISPTHELGNTSWGQGAKESLTYKVLLERLQDSVDIL